jgi:hypothetical protein
MTTADMRISSLRVGLVVSSFAKWMQVATLGSDFLAQHSSLPGGRATSNAARKALFQAIESFSHSWGSWESPSERAASAAAIASFTAGLSGRATIFSSASHR